MVCINLKPMVHRLEADYFGRIDFIYLDQYEEANMDVFARYALRGRPIFLLLNADGTEVRRWFGFVQEDELRGALDDLLAG
jgi:thioredoxin-like negative regulator of GroEL